MNFELTLFPRFLQSNGERDTEKIKYPQIHNNYITSFEPFIIIYFSTDIYLTFITCKTFCWAQNRVVNKINSLPSWNLEFDRKKTDTKLQRKPTQMNK